MSSDENGKPDDERKHDTGQGSGHPRGLPTYQFQLNKLHTLFDSGEDDDAFYERVRFERGLHRALEACNSEKAFVKTIAKIINALGYTNYSFVRLHSANNLSGRHALIPEGLFTSYDETAKRNSGVMFQAEGNSIYHQHLSLVYHFIASLAAGSDLFRTNNQQYLLLASTTTSYNIALCGFPQHSCQYCFRRRGTRTDTPPSFNGMVGPIDILASAIEVMGNREFPMLFRTRGNRALHIKKPPRRLLNTLAHEDTTMREAANILHLSIDTINKHIAQAKAVLGTKTLAGTMWMAIQHGLIESDD